MSGDGRGGLRFERLLMLAAAAVLAVALGLSEWSRRQEIRLLNERSASLSNEVALAQANAQAALAAIISPDAVARTGASVYLIVVNGSTRGTAFVVDRENGVLATAAHTADSLPLDEEGARVHILNRQTRAPLQVTAARLHAGYGAFARAVEAHQPIRKNSSIYAPLAAPVRDLAFDAAYIYVDPLDPETGENRLGPDLKIADEEKLLALQAGAPIAVIGYPYDTLDDGFVMDAAVSRAERGAIAAMIAPLDAAAYDSDKVLSNLIIHRLSTAGGSSGSPVIDVQGEVVGVHTHGVESISSNADGAAQRADVLHDLASPEREAARLSDIFMPSWRRTLSYWAKAEDALPWSFYMEYAQPDRKPAPTVGEIDFNAPAPFEKELQTLSFGEAVEEYAVDAEDASLQTDGEPLLFRIKEPGEYAETWISADRSRETVLFAFDYSLRSKSGYCKLTAFFRKRGETRLQVARNRASFELHLPRLQNDSEDLHVILRRPAGCDPISRTFFFGAISWAPADSVAAAPSDLPTGGAEGRFGVAVHAAQSRFKRFVGCRFGDGRAQDICETPEFIEISQ